MNPLIYGIKITRRGFLIAAILSLTFLAWYYVFSFSILPQIFNSEETCMLAYIFFNLVIAITLLLCRFFIHRLDRMRIIYVCSIGLTAIVFLLFASSIVLRLAAILVAGVFFSVGQLASFMYLWSITISEERGRVAGLAGFFSLTLLQLTSLMAQTLSLYSAIILSGILSFGTLSIKLLKPESKALLTSKIDDKQHGFEKKFVLLYSIPWILFSLINVTLSRNVSMYSSQIIPASLFMLLVVSQTLAAGFGALGGGIIADLFGRRLSLGVTLTFYGVSSALAGLFIDNYGILFFVYTVNGLNWGILWVLYGLVIWGDLANEQNCAKRYSTGLIIYYLSTGIGYLFAQQVSQIPLIISALSGCLLIFLSNIPVLLAPELLDADFRQQVKLKLYMNIVKKIRQKLSSNQG